MTTSDTPEAASVREVAIEILADVEHQRWAKWQHWLHRQCDPGVVQGSLVIPRYMVDRWDRQIATPYADLSDQEQESDRNEARTSLAALTAAGLRIVRDDPAVVRVPLDLAQSILAEWGSFIPTTADYEQLQEIVRAARGAALSEPGRNAG